MDNSNPLAKLSIQQLKRALKIKQEIKALEQELAQVIGAESSVPIPVRTKKKRTMSAAAKAKIAAAQKARWAERKMAVVPQKPAAKAKRRLSSQGRARIMAATKARWARYNAEKKKKKAAA